MSKLTEDQVAKFKRANNVRKKYLAAKWGMDVSSIRGEYYNSKVHKQPIVSKTTLPIIHDVTILDNSISMEGSKFNTALAAINKEIRKLKQSKDAVYFKTVSCFENRQAYWRTGSCILEKELPIAKISNLNIRANVWATPLYDTIVDTLEFLKKSTKGTNILVKIFTDGRDNDSESNAAVTCNLIKECEALGMTITFVGTNADVAYTVDRLGIEESNTLVHDNTSKGIETAFKTTAAASVAYVAKVAKGETVKTGFYKGL